LSGLGPFDRSLTDNLEAAEVIQEAVEVEDVIAGRKPRR
jgi:hypothetical protein